MKPFVYAGLAILFSLLPAYSAEPKNVIIFVADGLRPGSVNAQDTPAFERVRKQGVCFQNSHSIFPTVTTANASAIATGHALGDTGDFSNHLFVGYPVFDGRKIESSATQIPSVKKNINLKDVNLHYGGNYLNEASLLSVAREHGFATAAIGKMGPVLIQDVQLARFVGKGDRSDIPTVIIDAGTGRPNGVPLPQSILQAMQREGLPLSVPQSGHQAFPEIVAQRYFTDVFLKVVLPQFKKSKKPFVAVVWCADPDASQHGQDDSLSRFSPGVNGSTSRAAVKNADASLGRILNYLKADPQLAKSTNVVVVSDHGFSTVSKKWLNAERTQPTISYAAGFTYRNEKGQVVYKKGSLPQGFLAIDIAHALDMDLFDPDATPIQQNGTFIYPKVDPRGTGAQYPVQGNGLIGKRAIVGKKSGADVVVVSNGGCALVYLTKPALARRIVTFLTTQDYVGGIFVNRKICGKLPGTLGIDQIQLVGATKLPVPAIVIPYRSFALDAKAHPTQSQVLISDASYLEGQGDHGSFSRGDTFNFMAAIGPDFKKQYVDVVPVSNKDVPITCAQILGLHLPSVGHLRGRVIEEALVGGPQTLPVTSGTLVSRPTSSGLATRLIYQDVGKKHRYFDAGGFPGRTVGIPN
ncbi:MAG: alkaline phosphatase family protein [Verrucomicrobia bacterium]|nr:MAG: alkaline phosphatase family protein [Verrucomicrobiota bacterium]